MDVNNEKSVIQMTTYKPDLATQTGIGVGFGVIIIVGAILFIIGAAYYMRQETPDGHNTQHCDTSRHRYQHVLNRICLLSDEHLSQPGDYGITTHNVIHHRSAVVMSRHPVVRATYSTNILVNQPPQLQSSMANMNNRSRYVTDQCDHVTDVTSDSPPAYSTVIGAMCHVEDSTMDFPPSYEEVIRNTNVLCTHKISTV